MGAKLSKKKKGYCLGAGKDGESTDTTEVEQKETENQEGQKDDAAEPKGEKAPTDQSQSNGINEETKDSKSDVEATTGDTTKEESNQDQKPEIKNSTEEKDQPQNNKDEGKSAASDQACEKEKEKSSSEDKTKCEVKETPAVAADKPTQESKPVKENEGSECQQSNSCETKQSAKVEVEPVTKVEMEQTEKAPVSVETEGHASGKAAEVPTQANEPVAEPEKVPEQVEPSAPKSVTEKSTPVIKIEVAEPEVESSVQPTEEANSEVASVPEKVDSALPNTEPTSEPSLPEPVAATEESKPILEPEPSLVPVPEPEPSPLPEPVKSAVPEIKIEAPVPEQPIAPPEEDFQPEKEAEPLPCPASDQTSDQKEQELNPEPLPPKSTEVPNETTDAQEHTENQESLGCHDEGANAVTVQVSIEAASIEQPSEISEQHSAPVIQNGPSENLAEDHPAETHPISTDLKADDKEQKEAVEENVDLDKPPTQQESQAVKDCETPIDVSVTSKNENETNDSSQRCNSEDKTENHDQVKNERESPAPEILEKHGVGNGLPIKEEIKAHLENDCDKDLHDLNGQSESQEIQVCNE